MLKNNDEFLIFQEKTGLCVSGFRLAASVMPGNKLLHAMETPKKWRPARFAKTSEKQNSPGLVRQWLLAAQMTRLVRHRIGAQTSTCVPPTLCSLASAAGLGLHATVFLDDDEQKG